jgi:hypothetical protein
VGDLGWGTGEVLGEAEGHAMNVVVGSLFRDSAATVWQYMARVAKLRDALVGHTLRVIAVEGDSTDNTAGALLREAKAYNLDLALVTCNHGQPVFGSVENPERLIALSKVGNAVFDAVRPSDGILVYIESDLLWEAETIAALLFLAAERVSGFDIFAPMVFHANGFFYDVWAFRKNGQRFVHPPPYHIAFEEGLLEMDSVGSCLVMRASVARRCRMDENCLVGLCNAARVDGYRIAVATALQVVHP